MSQIITVCVSLLLIITLQASGLLFSAQFGGEQSQFDLVVKAVSDMVDKEGAVTSRVLQQVEQLAGASGLDTSKLDFTGSTVDPVNLFDVARVEMRYQSKIDNKPSERFDAKPEQEYHRIFYVTRTGR